MPQSHCKQLLRVERPNDVRFLTFSCNHRLSLFSNAKVCDTFADHLDAARLKHNFHLYAWVIMPEHVHLLLWPCLPAHPVAAVLHDLKRAFAAEVIRRWRGLNAPILTRLETKRGHIRFWQTGGGYDRNIFTTEEFNEKLRYIHLNPVTRGLVVRPEDWKWSSARWYAGDRTSPVSLDPLPPRKPSALPTPPPPQSAVQSRG
ncbi:MAG: REP-associated tyrosine transposase [Phycisphaerales bacterium]